MNVRRGVTLIELAVVFVILAIAASLAVPAFATWRPRSSLDQARTALIAALELARERSLTLGTAVDVTIDPARALVWLHPHDTSFVLTLPAACRLGGAPRMTLRFSPDGAARGQVPDIACGATRAVITVDALSGRIGGVP